MTDAPKVPGGKAPDPETIIELIEVVQIRYVVAALVIGAVAAAVILYMIGQMEDGTDDGADNGSR